MKRFAPFFSLALFLCVVPRFAHAVLPPDVIFSVGSQISSLVAGVGVFLFGSLLAVFPFMKGAFEKLKSARWLAYLVGLILFFGISSVSFYFFSTKEHVVISPPRSGNTATGTPETAGYRFFSDRFTLQGVTDSGKDFLVDLDLNRKETDTHAFEHYYFSNAVIGGKTEGYYNDETASGTAVLPNLFFSQFEKTKAEDHSSRDTYTFTFVLKGKEYHVVTEPLLADFITKNEPEYTSYVSAGKAQVTVEGKTLEMAVAHQAVYSTDYRKNLFFEGSDTLKSQSIQLIVWDEAKNFYVVDSSAVQGTSPAYASHFWALTKTQNGFAKKAFDGTAQQSVAKSDVQFSATIPAFDGATVTLALQQPFTDAKTEGYVRGQVTDAQGTRAVKGLGFFHVYGQENAQAQ